LGKNFVVHRGNELSDPAQQDFTRRLNQPVPDAIVPQIQVLSFAQLEALGEVLLDFTVLADVETWMNEHPSE
jgi:hypothetical protein